MKQRHKADYLFMVCLFMLFTMMCLFLAVSGAASYKRSASLGETNYNRRTSLSYITEKLRSYSAAGEICLKSACGEDAVRFTETINGEKYSTWIFFAGGFLREVTLDGEKTPIESDGQKIMALKALEFEEKNGLIEIRVQDASGVLSSVRVCPKARWRSYL